MFISVAIPADRNLIKKEAEKILKYKDLRIHVQPMWIVKAKVIPVIRGATGTISISLRQYPSNITGKHEIKEIIIKKNWAQHTCYGKCQCKSTKHISQAK
jgi:hypothetical protein